MSFLQRSNLLYHGLRRMWGEMSLCQEETFAGTEINLVKRKLLQRYFKNNNVIEL